MTGISPDRTQTLEVMGTKAFEDFVRQLEVEGLGIRTVTTPPPPPVMIEPIQERIAFDIAIPLTKPIYTHNCKKLSALDVSALEPIYEREEIEEEVRITLKMEFATTETKVSQVEIRPTALPSAQELVASITQKVTERARLTGVFAELYPIVRDYLKHRCFGQEIDINQERIRQHLRESMLQEGIASYLAKRIGQLTVEQREMEFEDRQFRLSQTEPFIWRRKHLVCEKTIFNYIAAYNDFEAGFAQFLDRCPDIVRFAKLAENFTRFRVDYVSGSGALRFYYPDFVAVQITDEGEEIFWVIETKGRPFEDLPRKEASVKGWCEKISQQTRQPWRYLRVDQAVFEGRKFECFKRLEQDLTDQRKGSSKALPFHVALDKRG